ncbi:MFS transporter [Mycolicibacterium goodii]|uniref:MFS transporter n=1 Tax=Mycolicibacterium goodii TaxID=134601 RepID=UPI00296E5787
MVGTALEWFDFFLFASMAALVFGQVFFPAFDSATATLASIATFGVGFFARPIGGIVFGALSDRFGRKPILLLSFILMGTASGLIGLLPSYEMIGIAAPVLLVLLRLIQGLGAGAEFSPAIAISYENANPAKRGSQGSWPALGSNLGLFLASIVVAILMTASGEFLIQQGGWRIPFIASFALVAVGLVMRTRMPEAPDFKASRKATASVQSPLNSLVRMNWRPLLLTLVVFFGSTAASYLFKTFSLAYLSTYRDVDASVGATGVAIATGIAILVVPIAGRMCDKFGPHRVLAAGGALIGLLAFPFFWMLDTNRAVVIWVALIVATGVAMPTMVAAQGAFFAGLFPAVVRGSGVGTGREIGGAIAGGLAPVTALALVQASPSNSTFGVSVIFLAAAVCVVGGVLYSVRLANPPSTADTATPASTRPLPDQANI